MLRTTVTIAFLPGALPGDRIARHVDRLAAR